MKLILKKVNFALIIPLAIVSFPLVSERFISVTSTPIRPLVLASEVPVPPAKGQPSNPQDLGRRGSCPSEVRQETPPTDEKRTETPLTFLVPLSPETLQKIPEQMSLKQWLLTPEGTVETMGVTSEALPTFWFYVPETSAGDREAEFTLLNERGETLVEKRFLLSKTPGIISFRLPRQEQFSGLNPGQKYRVYLSIICDEDNPAKNPTVDGWVTRVKLDLPSDLANQTQSQPAALLRKKLEFYLSNGIWHEALTLVGEYRRKHPNDSAFDADWAKLLRDNRFNEIETEPVVDCCTAKD